MSYRLQPARAAGDEPATSRLFPTGVVGAAHRRREQGVDGNRSNQVKQLEYPRSGLLIQGHRYRAWNH